MREREKKRKHSVLNIIKEHINNNLKEYCIVSLIFLIGIIIGVGFINNIKLDTQEKIGTYINGFVDCLKTNYQIDYSLLLKNSIINNLIFALAIWFMGCTVIGIPIVYCIIGIKGFTLGYTISSIILTLGIGKGIIFSIISLLLQNIITIPCILALAVSGMKLYKSIIKEKRKENAKIEIARHTIFSIFITIFLIVSSLIEVYISSNLINIVIGYI